MKRKYNTAAALQKAGMRAIAAFGEGRGAPGDGRREALFKERLHVLVCEALKNLSLNPRGRRDLKLLEADRLALGVMMCEPGNRSTRGEPLLLCSLAVLLLCPCCCCCCCCCCC